MDFDALLITFRTLSIIITCILGILGVLGTFRRKDGSLTRWGYASICFMVISLVASITTTLLEAKKEKTDTQQQLHRMEGLLREISRVGQPITELEVTYWVELSDTNNMVESYIKELDDAIASKKDELEKTFPSDSGLEVSATGIKGELLTVDVKKESPYWPKGQKKIIGDVAENFGFTIHIRKNPTNPETFFPVVSTKPGDSDWIAMHIPVPKKDSNRISMNYAEKTIEIFGTTQYDKKFWKTNGTIMSIQDLFGSQLFLFPPNSSDFVLPAKYKVTSNPLRKTILQAMKIKTIVFRFSAGREIWIDGAKFTKSRYRGGFPVFSMVLPTNETDMLSIAPRH